MTSSSMSSQAVVDLCMWKDVTISGAAVAVSLLFFSVVGLLGWSSLGSACLLMSLHLIARLAYYNTVGVRPAAPAEFFSEAEVQSHLTAITAFANSAAGTCFYLACAHDAGLTLKWAGGLLVVAFVCRLVGTTGFFFLCFVGAFSIPKVYELKQPEIDAALAAAQAKVQEGVRLAIAKMPPMPSIPKAADLKAGETEKKKL